MSEDFRTIAIRHDYLNVGNARTIVLPLEISRLDWFVLGHGLKVFNFWIPEVDFSINSSKNWKVSQCFKAFFSQKNLIKTLKFKSCQNLLDFSFLLLLLLILQTFCSRNVCIKLLQKPFDVNLEKRLVDFGASSEHRHTQALLLRVRCKICKNIFEVIEVFEETDQSLAYDFFKFSQAVNPLVD